MTIKDWMNYDYRCFSYDICKYCIFNYACKQKFHCGAETYSYLISNCTTKEEVKKYINYIREQEGNTWSMSCSGKGVYPREDLRNN